MLKQGSEPSGSSFTARFWPQNPTSLEQFSTELDESLSNPHDSRYNHAQIESLKPRLCGPIFRKRSFTLRKLNGRSHVSDLLRRRSTLITGLQWQWSLECQVKPDFWGGCALHVEFTVGPFHEVSYKIKGTAHTHLLTIQHHLATSSNSTYTNFHTLFQTEKKIWAHCMRTKYSMPWCPEAFAKSWRKELTSTVQWDLRLRDAAFAVSCPNKSSSAKCMMPQRNELTFHLQCHQCHQRHQRLEDKNSLSSSPLLGSSSLWASATACKNSKRQLEAWMRSEMAQHSSGFDDLSADT